MVLSQQQEVQVIQTTGSAANADRLSFLLRGRDIFKDRGPVSGSVSSSFMCVVKLRTCVPCVGIKVPLI